MKHEERLGFWVRVVDFAPYFDPPEHPAAIRLVWVPVIRRTPAGVWLQEPGGKPYWCGWHNRKSRAYPTVALAWDSFRRRKSHQVWHLERALERARFCLEHAKAHETFVEVQHERGEYERAPYWD